MTKLHKVMFRTSHFDKILATRVIRTM